MSAASLLSRRVLYRHGLSSLRRSSAAASIGTSSSEDRNIKSADTNIQKRNMCAVYEEQQKCLNMSDLNPCVKVMEYAVRGPLVIRAGQIEKELEQVI